MNIPCRKNAALVSTVRTRHGGQRRAHLHRVDTEFHAFTAARVSTKQRQDAVLEVEAITAVASSRP
ncbi:hypothetical protein ACIQU1_03905 [Streptomyces angustmyceticus]|uniref:hypothetical protein n=1 Tax=Streptomyces angustmyceticus TaxID=285578 RepID=UPI00382CFDA6